MEAGERFRLRGHAHSVTHMLETCLFETLSGPRPRAACHRSAQCQTAAETVSLSNHNGYPASAAGPARRAPSGGGLCLGLGPGWGSDAPFPPSLFHLRPDTHSRLSVPSTSPAPSRLCGHIVKSLIL